MAQGLLPAGRRHLVGDAVVDGDLVELVRAIGQAQRFQAQHPQDGIRVPAADRRLLPQHVEEVVARQPAQVQRLLRPGAEQVAQLGAGLDVDLAQRRPVDHPGHRQVLAAGAHLRHRLGVQVFRRRPGDAARAAARGAFLLHRLGHQLGQREPLRRGQPELLGVVVGQLLELALLAGRPVQVEQHQPGLGVIVARAARARQVDQAALAVLVVGIGEGDHRLVQLGVVNDLADLDLRVRDAEAQRRDLLLQLGDRRGRGGRLRGHAAAHRGRGRRRRQVQALDVGRRGVVGHPRADLVRRLRRGEVDRFGAGLEEAGRVLTLHLRGDETLAHHLLLDLVDLGLDAGFIAAGALDLADAAQFVDAGGRVAAQRGQLFRRQALAADLAQHVELALAHEIVAPLALHHRPQLGLGGIGLGIVLAGVDLRPVGRRIGDEARHLAEEALAFFGAVFGVGHALADLALRAARLNRRTSSASARGAAALPATAWRSGGRSGDPGRSARRSRRSSRTRRFPGAAAIA